MGAGLRYFLTAPDTQPRVAEGSYFGTGSGTQDIVMNFQPDYVQVSCTDNGTERIFCHRYRIANAITIKIASTIAGGAAVVTAPSNAIISINSNGFTIGTADGLNVNNAQYFYMAVKGKG